jgi:hypothetical protein
MQAALSHSGWIIGSEAAVLHGPNGPFFDT